MREKVSRECSPELFTIRNICVPDYRSEKCGVELCDARKLVTPHALPHCSLLLSSISLSLAFGAKSVRTSLQVMFVQAKQRKPHTAIKGWKKNYNVDFDFQ